MKNQYFGDINDYRKYGLIRSLTQNSTMNSAICWMLTPDDQSNDGSKRDYLTKPNQWEVYDTDLFKALSNFSRRPEWPNVGLIEESDLLQRALFNSDFVPTQLSERKIYFDRVSEESRDCEFIFFNPNNGMQVPSLRPNDPKVAKYLFWDEVIRFHREGHSILVYQHYPREQRSRFVERMKHEFCERAAASRTFAFTTSPVVFFLVPQDCHVEVFDSPISAVRQNWTEQMIDASFINSEWTIKETVDI